MKLFQLCNVVEQLYAEAATVCRRTIITLAPDATERSVLLQQIKYVHENARRGGGGSGGTAKFRTRDKDKLNQHEIMSV